jgi:hypothetical protein
MSDTPKPKPSCDCWKYERQVCDVCQGVSISDAPNDQKQRGRATCNTCKRTWTSTVIPVGVDWEIGRHHSPGSDGNAGPTCDGSYSLVVTTEVPSDPQQEQRDWDDRIRKQVSIWRMLPLNEIAGLFLDMEDRLDKEIAENAKLKSELDDWRSERRTVPHWRLDA